MYSGDIIKSPKGKYEIERRLGNGAFGIVYLTKFRPNNSSRSEKIAVKKVEIDNNPDYMDIRSCLQEARIMKQISDQSRNNHIVQYFESFIRGGILQFVFLLKSTK